MSSIVFSLSEIDRGIREVLAYADKVKVLADKLCYELAEQVQADAQQGYSGYSERNTVQVAKPTPNDEGNGYIVSASGWKEGEPTVLFEEFGAGVATGENNPKAIEFGAIKDTYSYTHAQLFHDFGYWWYGGQRIDRVYGTNAMYNASILARRSVIPVARRIFNGGAG